MHIRPACLISYFAAWNALDADEIRKNVNNAFGDNTRYFDPHRTAVGVDEFVACLVEFRAQSPQAVISWASEVDSHHHLHRYTWLLQIGERKLTGNDVVEVDELGKIVSLFSFFNPVL